MIDRNAIAARARLDGKGHAERARAWLDREGHDQCDACYAGDAASLAAAFAEVDAAAVGRCAKVRDELIEALNRYLPATLPRGAFKHSFGCPAEEIATNEACNCGAWDRIKADRALLDRAAATEDRNAG